MPGPGRPRPLEERGHRGLRLHGGTGARAEGLARWFDPLLLGLRPETPALIPYWIGAWAIKLAPAWITPDLAVRVVFALLLWGAFTRHLVRGVLLRPHARAQPVAFAFGGEARPTDYARAIADGAPDGADRLAGPGAAGPRDHAGAGTAVFHRRMFYGMAALPYRRIGPGIAMRWAWSAWRSAAPRRWPCLGAGCALFRRRAPAARAKPRRRRARLHAAAPRCRSWSPPAGRCAGRLARAWCSGDRPARQPNRQHGGGRTAQPGASLLMWFTWPAWPLALWTLWRWRRQLKARHVALPLWFVLVPLAAPAPPISRSARCCWPCPPWRPWPPSPCRPSGAAPPR